MFGIFGKFFIIGLIISIALVIPGHQIKAQVESRSTYLDPLYDIIEGIGEGMDDLLNPKPLEKLENSKCLASFLSGGTSGIKKTGHLIIGTNCDDKIEGDDYDDIIYSLAGVDRVFAGAGNDIIYGGPGDNRLYGENGDDIVVPGEGADIVDGGSGNDLLFGGVGNTLLAGGDGNDQLIAGIGATLMYGGSGSNNFDCGINSMILDYNPDNGDIVAGKCKIVNNVVIDFPNYVDIP